MGTQTVYVYGCHHISRVATNFFLEKHKQKEKKQSKFLIQNSG